MRGAIVVAIATIAAFGVVVIAQNGWDSRGYLQPGVHPAIEPTETAIRVRDLGSACLYLTDHAMWGSSKIGLGLPQTAQCPLP